MARARGKALALPIPRIRAVGDRAETLAHETGDIRNDAVADAPFDIGGIAAVDADDDHGTGGPPIGDAVEKNAATAHGMLSG